MPCSVPIVFLFSIWVFFMTVLIAWHPWTFIFLAFQSCSSSWSRSPGFLVVLFVVWVMAPASFLGVVWASGRALRPPGSEHKWWLGMHGWQWSNCSPVETEIERVQRLHFPLVAFLLILCIWKRQLNANCWLTVFPGMETIWIISMSFS